MALIAFDARKASARMPHGSGIYARCLLAALRSRPSADHELWAIESGGSGTEVWWEQVVLPRRLRNRQAALIHGPDSFLPLRRSCAGVVTVHDLAFAAMPVDTPGPTGWKYRRFVPRVARSAERVICPSRFTADDLSERCGVRPERIRVIPEAAALPIGSAAPPPGPYLLAVGDLRPKKNLPRLVQAFRRLRDEGLGHRLVIVGADVGMGQVLEEVAAGAPVEFTGYVDDDSLDATMRGADALVIASLYEGFGLAVLDAMARGCPAILARAGALPETGGQAAAYFDPHDTDALVAAIRRVVEDPAERARLSKAGRQHAAQFTWEQTAAQTAAVYEELLG